VVSWAIVGQKLIELRRARRQTAAFLRVFRSDHDAGLIYRQARELSSSPLAALFCAVYDFFVKQPGRGRGWAGEREDVRKLLEGMAGLHMARLERYLPFLATVANVSPFLGLLGTVWGIITAFFEIGLQGSASLAVVAPGMAEALSTTAFGLGAAIPAVIAYNYFNSRLNGVERELERFVAELAVVLTADNESRPA